jgi:hypothetical protein
LKRVALVFAVIWGVLGLLVNVLAVFGTCWANGFPECWSIVAGWYSPTNFWNLAAELVLFSPAIFATWYGQRP